MIPEWETLGVNDDHNVGGCRIKKITNTPGTVTEFKYIKDYNQNQNGVSSGLLTDYGVFRVRYERGNGQYYDQLFDQNISQASSISESPVCYSQVVEISGNGTEGFSKFVFTNPDNEEYMPPGDSPDNYFLGSNTIRIYGTSANVTSFMNQMKRLSRYSSRAAERGKLWKKEVYNSSNSLIASEEYQYNRSNDRFNEKTVGYERTFNLQIPDATQDFGYLIQSFEIYSYHNNPSQIVRKTFSNGQTLTQTTNFSYKGNNNPLLTEQTTTQSDGSVFKTQYFYPEDKAGDPEYPASAGMVAKNMLGTVVEERTFKGTQALMTQKYIYSDVTGSGGYKPVLNKTINYTISGSGTEEGANITYYSDGKAKESYKTNDFKTAYIWDYKKTFPIAEVKNVTSASDIAYTSFETTENWSTGGYNQWVYNTSAIQTQNTSPTGASVFNLNYGGGSQTITRSLDPAKQYVLSLWFNGSAVSVGGLTAVNGETISGWTYKEYAVTGLNSITISGTGLIDELRLYPKGSLMTTYAYQPLHGIMSQCDANNKISYYIYDLSGRLTLIVDKDFKVVKKICYNYFNEVVNCSDSYFRNSLVSQVFTKNDCGEGYEGSSVTYTIPANTYGSSSSSSDADQQAQADINYYGQAYANAHGTCSCTVNSCSGVGKKCEWYL
jgi:hypothetical protein